MVAKKALVIVGLVLAGPLAGDLGAQLPDEYTNLQVFPEDIDQRTLINYMRSFAIGLGVRCTHCHVGEEGQPLSTYDFASDDKVTKRKARVMIEMVMAINERHLEELPEREEDIEVTCATCHRGLPAPRILEDVLMEAYADGGVAGLIERYRTLRERYYGTYSFDFTEHRLNEVANRVSDTSLADATTVLELNQEFFAGSAHIEYLMGEVLLASGDAGAATAKFERALELDPNHRGALRRLQQSN
ncbi:MAG: c-type cytochrome [Gemmatimonadales bacterium]